MSELNSENVDAFIHQTLDTLYERDEFLLKRDLDVNERAITFRMGMHLQQILTDEFDVDCEYNRMGRISNGLFEYTEGDYFVKTIGLSVPMVSSDDDNGSRVFPDIIVHKRGTPKNHIIIEVKVDWKSSKAEYDMEKLIAYKRDLKYEFAIYIQLTEDRENVVIKKL